MDMEEMVLAVAVVLVEWYNNVRGTVMQEASRARNAMTRFCHWARQNSERHEQLEKSVKFIILLFCASRKIFLGVLGLVWVAFSFLLGSPLSFVLGLVRAAFPFLLAFALGVCVSSVGFYFWNRLQCARPSSMVSTHTPEHFDLSDYSEIISRSVAPVPVYSNEVLYFRLCNFPILLDDGKLSFSLHISSGKKCWMLGAKLLSITHADTPKYWEWNSLRKSRFYEVAYLKKVWYLEIRVRIQTNMLSPQTTYAAYLVYQLQAESQNGFHGRPIMLRVTNERRKVERSVFLDPPEDMPPRSRGDGWMELELSTEIFNKEDNATVELLLRDDDTSIRKSGLIVEGIELRPKPI